MQRGESPHALLGVPKKSFFTWKGRIAALRESGAYDASSALLSLGEGPSASAPPSPPVTDETSSSTSSYSL